MFKHLPTYDYALDTKYNVAKEDAFYLVVFDNFMSPSARYADYVLPAKTTWEQEDFMNIENGAGYLYIDSFIPGPGEAMSTWDFAREFIKAYGGEAAAIQYTGDGSNTTFRQVVQKAFLGIAGNEATIPNPAYNNSIPFDPVSNPLYIPNQKYNSEFAGKTWEEFLEKPIIHAKPNESTTTTIVKSDLRNAYEAANKNVANLFNIDSYTAIRHDGMFGLDEFAETATAPNMSKRFHVYSDSLVWRYRNLFSKWQGYLDNPDEQGQINLDEDMNLVVYPIPMYFDYHDYFREAYGLVDNSELEGRYLLTTTHDRFRAHSSQAENPYLRELTHRTIGGKLYSGNDAGAYATASDSNFTNFPPLNSLIGDNGLPIPGTEGRASYIDIWVNDEDFAGYQDGELVLVENEIGAVLCAVRKTKRCVKGYVGLHQGAWFDPRKITIDGKERIVDVGGCCNTLMASKPSRIDHGNAQQSAMVKIRKFR
jgi:anaerobic selenocysteine-containing dehydrogenase